MMKNECVWCADSRTRIDPRTMTLKDCGHCRLKSAHRRVEVDINSLVKTARPLAFTPSTEKELVNRYAERVRHGKTAKDHKRRPHTEAA